MEYFYNTLGIVCGVLLPVYLAKTTGLMILLAREALKRRAARYEAFMEPKNWVFLDAQQAPNKDYISVRIANGESGDPIKIGIEKTHLAPLLK